MLLDSSGKHESHQRRTAVRATVKIRLFRTSAITREKTIKLFEPTGPFLMIRVSFLFFYHTTGRRECWIVVGGRRRRLGQPRWLGQHCERGGHSLRLQQQRLRRQRVWRGVSGRPHTYLRCMHWEATTTGRRLQHEELIVCRPQASKKVPCPISSKSWQR